ncbi:cysteinyl-trna synthetase [Vairimorpha apis BRL 01]|nr:cysteinyl-trna synthetase [Vairimorpha apis BRL 01]
MGQDIDIHAGGIDLKFPHHENEVAQCQAYFNKKWCNYFMHTGHLNINGLKMSKSLKNFTTIKSILTKCSPIQLRILFLYHHWNSDMSYEEEQLKFAESVEKKIFNFVENVNVVKDSVDNIVKDNISDRLNSVDNVYINKLSTKIKDMKIEEKAAAGKNNSYLESSVNSVDNKNISSSKDSITKTNNNFSKCSFISSDDNQVLDKLSSTLSTIHFSYCNNFDTPSVMKSILELISFTRTKNIKNTL